MCINTCFYKFSLLCFLQFTPFCVHLFTAGWRVRQWQWRVGDVWRGWEREVESERDDCFVMLGEQLGYNGGKR